jgi:cytidyltransferase-like protein
MKTVFISGCYDILHAGHLLFMEEARAMGDRLVVCFASKDVLWKHKKRQPSIPDDHKKSLLEALWMVDEVVIGNDKKIGLDFESHFRKIKPDLLIVTDDDKYADLKKELCEEVGAEYCVIEKKPPQFKQVSTSELIKNIRAPKEAPMRVDFAGGWLDVPSLAQKDGFIVNCAISPTVSLNNWPYERNSGLGGSGAWAIISGKEGVEEELKLGVGWQDPAIIQEGGLCVWRSGDRPVLEFKNSGDLLKNKMAILWTGKPHNTPSVVSNKRPYDVIKKAGQIAAEAVKNNDIDLLAEAIGYSYKAQLKEGMDELPDIEGAIAKKYCGGGWGGYALYLFKEPTNRDKEVDKNEKLSKIEPWINWNN